MKSSFKLQKIIAEIQRVPALSFTHVPPQIDSLLRGLIGFSHSSKKKSSSDLKKCSSYALRAVCIMQFLLLPASHGYRASSLFRSLLPHNFSSFKLYSSFFVPSERVCCWSVYTSFSSLNRPMFSALMISSNTAKSIFQ